MAPYFPPPDGYEPPTRCTVCGEIIIFTAQISGYPKGVWAHLPGGPGHQVGLDRQWWDTATGRWETEPWPIGSRVELERVAGMTPS